MGDRESGGLVGGKLGKQVKCGGERNRGSFWEKGKTGDEISRKGYKQLSSCPSSCGGIFNTKGDG